MSPNIALLLCAGFVFLLLRLERKQAPEVSLASWIPTLWMLYIASKPLAVWVSPSSQTEAGDSTDAGSPLDRNFLTGLLFVGLWILHRRRMGWGWVMREHRWLFWVLGFMLLSVVWSDIAFVSFKRWVRQFEAVVMGLIVLSEPSPHLAIQSILRRVTYVLIPLSILLLKYFPVYGVEFDRWSGYIMWVGVTTQKNGLGRLCLISGFFLIWTFATNWGKKDARRSKYQNYADGLLLLMVAYLLKGPSGVAASMTGVTSLVIGTGALVALLWMKRKGRVPGFKLLGAGIAGIIVIGALTPPLGGATVGALTGHLGRDATLTGRTDIWAVLLPEAAKHPLLGAGFGGFWTNETVRIAKVNEAHNGYLGVFLETGGVGLCLLSFYLLGICRRAQRAMAVDFDSALFCFCFLLMFVLHNISEASMNLLTNPLAATLLFLGLSLPGEGALAEEFAPESASYGDTDVSPDVTEGESGTVAALGLKSTQEMPC